jgi:hypothetical protein
MNKYDPTATVQITKQQSLLDRMVPLLQILGAPKDPPQLFPVLARFQPILEQLILIADDQSHPNLEHLLSLVVELRQEEDELKKMMHVAGDLERGFHGYMKSHPLYCIFGEPVLDLEIAPHHLALIASAYQALLQLQAKFREDPSEYSSTTYQVGLAFRNLAQPDAIEKELLLKLPSSAMSQENYLAQVDAVAEEFDIKLSTNSDYACFYWVRRLLDGLERNSWNRDDTAAGGRPSPSRNRRRKKAMSEGVVEFTRIPTKDVGTEPTGLKVINYFRRTPRAEVVAERFDPGLQADAQPDETSVQLQPGKILQYHYRQRREQSAQNARYAAQAIEIANQSLPISLGTLSQYEVICFFSAIILLPEDQWSNIPAVDRNLVAAWAGLRFFLSRPAEALQGMRVAVSKGTPLPFWSPTEKTVSLSTLPPKHKSPQPESNALPVGGRIVLKIPTTLSNLLGRLDSRRGDLFAGRHADMESHLGTLLNSINHKHGTALTPPRLQRAISERMSLLAPSDGVIGCYFQGRPPNSHIPAVYSAVPVSRIQQLFDQAWDYFYQAGSSNHSKCVESQLPGLVQLNAEFVGSLQVPRPDFVKSTIADVVLRINALSKVPAVGVIELHNLYTTYVTLFLLVTSGMRSLSQVLPGAIDVDWKSGVCLASEKDNNRYTEARLVFLLPMVLEQLRCYREHVQRLRKYLALWNPKALDQLDLEFDFNDLSSHKTPRRDVDLVELRKGAPVVFMLSTRGAQVLPVRESQLQELLGKDWNLRLGAMRHFVRSQLLWAGCAGEAIDALLGHWIRGAEPWGRFSTLPPAKWSQQIDVALIPLVEQLGLKVLPSPLQR